MKAKKICFLVGVLVLTSFLLVSIASAGWYYCTIDRVGVNSVGKYIVFLSDTAAVPAFTNSWYVLNPAFGKELLALALTAQVNGKIFYVNLSTITQGTTLVAAYMRD